MTLKKFKKFSFKFEDLVVDYFELKFDALPEYGKQKIVEFFFKLGFNSFDVDKKYRESQSTQIQINSKNQYQIQFVVNISTYWDGLCPVFSSKSTAFFYQLLKEKKIDWNLFPAAKINRLDLNYLRPIHSSQKRLVVDFFKQSEETIRAKGVNARINSTKTELSLKIASKRSNRSAKIYDVGRQRKFLKFEMEIRRTLIANYKPDFLSNNFERIEDSLTREFLNYFWKLLPLKNEYADWLLQKGRPIVNNAISSIVPAIYTDYIAYQRPIVSALSIKNFIMVLKFIAFTKKLDYEIRTFDSIDYRVIVFKVKDFSDECDSLFNSSNNFYNIDQVKKFLRQLQQNIFVEIFNDSHYMQTLASQHQTIVEMDSLAGIHRVTIFKPPGSKYLLARVVMMDNLFYYLYPFRLPDLFQGNLTKHERLVRVEFIKTFSSKNVEKYFYLREFFKTYKISNQKIKEIKQIFIDIIHILQQHQLIEQHILLLSSRSRINNHDLTTANISDSTILYEKFDNNFLLNRI
jgi:hypothetical protein